MLFAKISTQWRTNMAGPIGLDYLVLYHELDRLGLSPDDYEALFRNVQVLEAETLAAIQEQRKRN